MSDLLATIPYSTFPHVDLGFATIDTFGLTAALGVVIGMAIAIRHVARVAGVPAATVYLVGARIVLAGFAGARLTWVVTNLDLISSWGDVFAIQEGGLQFSGGFAGAIVVGALVLRKMSVEERWVIADGLGLGLTLGLALGRVGCLAVGEHFGSRSSFPLAVRYVGGELHEPLVGDQAVLPGTTFHQTALYELLFLVVLFVVFRAVARRNRPAGTLIGLFSVCYGSFRFLLDLLRVNDERLLGLTGAQYLMVVVVIGGAAVLRRSRPVRAAEEAPEAAVDVDVDRHREEGVPVGVS